MGIENEGKGAASKTYNYDYEQYDDENKNAQTMIEEIMADPDLPHLKEIIIGSWGGAWEEDCQSIIDGIVENKEKFSHIEKLYFGDMDYEECEVSWIEQGDYSKLWDALPQLKEFTVKGSMDLDLGKINHENLESLTIICGGLPVDIFKKIQEARLPKLKKLLLYIGVDSYGFDGDLNTIKKFLETADFPSLTYLGLTDSELQDEVTELVLDSKFMGQLETLDLSNGTLTDKGGQLLLDRIPLWPNIRKLDVHYHYLTNDMVKNLKKLPIALDISDQNEPHKYKGEIWMNPMLTE